MQYGISIWEVKKRIFAQECSVACLVTAPVDQPNEGLSWQEMEDGPVLLARCKSDWTTYAAIAGIAQYSLLHNVPTWVVGRFNHRLRAAETHEAAKDFQRFGDQVVGEVEDAKTRGVPCWPTLDMIARYEELRQAEAQCESGDSSALKRLRSPHYYP